MATVNYAPAFVFLVALTDAGNVRSDTYDRNLVLLEEECQPVRLRALCAGFLLCLLLLT